MSPSHRPSPCDGRPSSLRRRETSRSSGVHMTTTGEKQVGSKVAIIGTGYVGLTTGACLAHLGHTVVCADVVPEKVEALSRGEVPILEAGLDELVAEGLSSGELSFVLGAENAVADAEFIYLCVP